jgi:hypothetical protein
MKKIILVSVALLLSGCATQFGERISTVISAAQNFEITQGQLDSVRNTYDGFVLAPLNKYASLPRCKTGIKFTINNPCHDRKLLKQIREEDKIIATAINDTQNSITSGDNKGAIAAYRTLTTAIELAKTLINQTGVSLLGV